MKYIILTLGTFFYLSAYCQSTVIGQWKTIDDATQVEKSIVEIYEQEGKIFGKIIKLFQKPDEDQDPKCDKCSGEMKDQKVLGMVFMKNLKKESQTTWDSGEITDPKNGKTYSCKIELIEDGKKLKVRGFLGISLFGRTQVWIKQ